MADPTPLSPAAQAIMDGFWDTNFDNCESIGDFRRRLAAATLRAAADQGENFHDPHEGKVSAVRVEHLLAIAAELEGANG